ncbi:GNAT family N-acetyltransferase [Tumebacillus flagellatus]|uniref:GNAT family N-acetyltransferase n=1 Tax=Tumebacillus flagellatus TaxID=1157490 RepID=UPI001930B5A7|nr:GNAT family N-acetyltransferase [Tumebacillus flagellatus]
MFDLYASTRQEEMSAWGWDDFMQQNFLTMQWNAQRMSYEAQFPDAHHHVLMVNEQPVGRLLVNQTPEELHIVDIALLPEARNRGVGSAVLQELQAQARSLGVPLKLRVLHTNPARRLYERLGFRVVHEDAMSRHMEWQETFSLDTTISER